MKIIPAESDRDEPAVQESCQSDCDSGNGLNKKDVLDDMTR
jgi:hypothetical protein